MSYAERLSAAHVSGVTSRQPISSSAHGVSTTAYRVAAYRAQHQLFDEPQVFVDPLAVTIFDEREVTALTKPEGHDDVGARARRAFFAARARCAEDALQGAFARGIRQYVILGAGFDTFAYRNPHPGLRVFEVDRPATQHAKRGRLRDRGVVEPASVQFVPLDFERESLSLALSTAGCDPRLPTYFSWLGVTPYLEAATTLACLQEIAAYPPGSGVTFDYALDRRLMPPRERASFDDLAARVAAAGEPFLGSFAPEEIQARLSALHFGRIDDLGREALNERFFEGRQDGLRVLGMAHVLTAWVEGEP